MALLALVPIAASCNSERSTLPTGGVSAARVEATSGAPVAATGAATSTQSAPSVAPFVPELFRPLFVLGAKWDYSLEVASSHLDPTDPTANSQGTVQKSAVGTMTCQVGSVQPVAAATVAVIECERTIEVPLANSGPAGVLVATAAGLWRLDAVPTSSQVAALQPGDQLLAAAPVVITSRREEGAEHGSLIEVKRAGADWCVRRQSWGGDESGSTFCFRAGVGISSGADFFAGGSVLDISYSLR